MGSNGFFKVMDRLSPWHRKINALERDLHEERERYRQITELLTDRIREVALRGSQELGDTATAITKCLKDLDERGCAERAALAENVAKRLDALEETERRERSAVARDVAERLDALDERGCAERAALAENIAKRLNVLEEKVLTIRNEFTRSSIKARWQVVDSMDRLLFPADFKAQCPICGHAEARSNCETRVSMCQFGGGILERYVCPDCGAIFGPLKMMALNQEQLAEEYRQNYSVFSESDCTRLEKIAFEALKPSKQGVYLNFGAGAWNRTTRELRETGYQVYDFEPYAPVASSEWVVKTREELAGRKFDGIFSNDLIEHLQNPVEDLKFMAGLLTSDGQMSHASGCYEYAFEYTRFHLFFLTGQSLGRLASSAGLSYELGERLFSYSPARICLFSRNKDKGR